MDKELIAMCDCPEIQDRWEPKDGDRFYNTHFKGHWMLPDREACEGGDECECCKWEEHEVKESKYIIYIPRIEAVLEWLGDKFLQMHYIASMKDWKVYSTPTGYAENVGLGGHDADTPIKALIKAYMHLEHNKTWNGEAWA